VAPGSPFAVRGLGLRGGAEDLEEELLVESGLRWSDVDFNNGVLTVRITKQGIPLLFEIPNGLLWVLKRWQEVSAGQPTDPVVRKRVKRHVEATVLREDLLAAGVTRELLHQQQPGVERLRFHDLRATFVTWAKRQGRGDGWITDRTGYLSPSMIEQYNRAARTLADLRIEPFPELARSIPELLESSRETSRNRSGGRTVAGSRKEKK
jgi:integrase